MNVCLISDEYLKETPLGGIGTYTRQLGKLITSSGNKVTIITFGTHPGKWKKGKMALIVLKRIQIPKLSLIVNPFLVLVELVKLNKQRQVDIIEVPEWGSFGFFIVIFRRLFGQLPPLVIRLHTPLVISRFYNSETLSILDRVRDWMESFSVKNCDVVTCPTQTLSMWATKNWHLERPIVLIPNFVEIIDSEVKVSIDHKEKIVLFMGSLATVKGFDTLLNALPILLRETDAECHIIGRKTSSKHLNHRLEEVLINWKTVKYFGFLEGTAKNIALEQSDVVVIPSLWDNFPMTCIEAMASSKVVVASEVGGLKEMVSDGVNGFLVPSGDHKILASVLKKVLIMDSTQRKYLEDNARRTVETKYSSSVVGKNIIRFYFHIAKHEKNSKLNYY